MKINVGVELNKEETEVVMKLIGNYSPVDITALGLSNEEADMLNSLYNQWYNFQWHRDYQNRQDDDPPF